jgi:hypothetical protein
MEIIGYLIFIWALTQSLWLAIRWFNRAINPGPIQFDLRWTPSTWFAEYAEREIVAVMNKRALEDIQAIEDAEFLASLSLAINAERNHDTVC